MSNETLEQVKAERDALAAHVEACQPIIEAYADAAFFDRGHEDVKEDAKKLRNMKPTTSLARRDARMKAEALERFATEWSESVSLMGTGPENKATRMASDYRHQSGDQS